MSVTGWANLRLGSPGFVEHCVAEVVWRAGATVAVAAVIAATVVRTAEALLPSEIAPPAHWFPQCVDTVCVAAIISLIAFGVWFAISILCAPTDPREIATVRATQEMTTEELLEAVAALRTTRDRLQQAGHSREAAQVATDWSICLVVLAERRVRPEQLK